MAVVSEVTSMDMQECRRVEAIRRSSCASNGDSSASFVVVVSLVSPCNVHDLTRMKVSSAPTPYRLQRNISIHAFIRTDRSCLLTHGDDGGEDVHEGEELDSEHEGVEGVGEAQREGDAGGGRQRQEEALGGKMNQLGCSLSMIIGMNLVHQVVV